jgi:integrase
MITRSVYTDDVSQNLGKCIGDRYERIEMNGEMTLLRFVDMWMEIFKKNSVKSGTYGRLVTSRKALERYDIANKMIGEIDFFDIQKYINQIVEDGYSVGEVKKRMLIVTAPLKQAAAMRIISADPCVGLRMPSEDNVKKRKREIVAYTREEQEKIGLSVRLNPENVGYLAVLFMIETGIRSGELLALKWSDLQLERCRMHVHATIVNPMYNTASYQDSPKSKSSNRILPLTPKALQILKSLVARRKTEWVFEQNGKRYTYQKLMYQTKKLCRESGIKYYGEHAFRHTFATNCYYKGIDVKILSRLMGHSSVQVTYNIYINLYGDGFDDMYAALCF